MRTALVFRAATGVVAALTLFATGARAQTYSTVAVQWTNEELENLLAPVALYPDPILAQVLVAASYPDEVELAAQHVQLYGQQHIDRQPWDISVKAVAHYEPVLNLMADRMDWTVALGQAYAEQPDDVMRAVQSLRAMARAHGNLISTSEQEVVVEDRYIRIVPAQPRVIYVPRYDPYVVYHRPVVHLGVYSGGWSFGVAFPIGVWLTYDFDWRRRHIYYHGWDRHWHPWIHRSRPFIVINNIYVRPRPRVVIVNRRVVDRYVDYRGFDRYDYVHRRLAWDRARPRSGRGVADGPSWDRDRRARQRGVADGPPASWNRGNSPIRGIADGPANRPANVQDIRRGASGRDEVGPTPRQQTRPEPSRIRPGSERITPPTRRARPESQGIIRPGERQVTPPQQRARPEPSRIQPGSERTTPPARRSRAESQGIIRSEPASPGVSRARPEARRITPASTVSRPRARPDRPRQRATPQRATPQRSQPQRATPQRSQPRRITPQRSQPQRATPQRAQPRGRPAVGRAGSSRAGRGRGGG